MLSEQVTILGTGLKKTLLVLFFGLIIAVPRTSGVKPRAGTPLKRWGGGRGEGGEG